MSRLYFSITLFLILLFVAVMWYFFGVEISRYFSLIGQEQNVGQLVDPTINQEPAMSKDETKALLSELLPEDIVDTQEEVDEQIKLLEQLNKTTNTSIEGQEALLEQLAQ